MRISDWSSDVCSSDLWAIVFGGTIAPASSTIAHVQTHPRRHRPALPACQAPQRLHLLHLAGLDPGHRHRRGRADHHARGDERLPARDPRSEEHTSELQSLMRISYAVFCLKKKKNTSQE